MKHLIFHACCWLAGLMFSTTLYASDHERAHALLEKGEILSLTEILSKTSSQVPGKLLAIELEEKDNRITYEIEFLRSDGVVMKMYVDAKTAEIISLERD